MRCLSRSRLAGLFAAAALLSGAATTVVPTLSAAAETKTYVPCLDSYGDEGVVVKPRTCTFEVADITSRGASVRAGDVTFIAAGSVYVTNMRWRHWGSRTATASGTYRGNMDATAKGTVKLSGRKRCTGYGYVYTRFRMTFRGDKASTFNFRLNSCA